MHLIYFFRPDSQIPVGKNKMLLGWVWGFLTSLMLLLGVVGNFQDKIIPTNQTRGGKAKSEEERKRASSRGDEGSF